MHDPKLHNVLAIERTICHALWHASLCAEREENIDKALQYAELALNEWKTYRTNHPEDTLTNVSEFMSAIEKKKEFLQRLPRRDVW